jgi:hypothetical protein
MEYADHAGAANIQLLWSSPTMPKQVIPTAQLYASGGWLNTDLGTPPSPGSTTTVGGTWTVRGSGSLGGTDAGQFAYQALAGDGTVVAKSGGFSAGGSAGVLLRGGTGTADAFAAVLLTDTGAVFEYRATAGGVTSPLSLPGVSAYSYLKLVRNGSLVSGYASATGADGSWKLVGSAAINLPGTALAGLYAGGATLNTASFSNVASRPAARTWPMPARRLPSTRGTGPSAGSPAASPRSARSSRTSGARTPSTPASGRCSPRRAPSRMS